MTSLVARDRAHADADAVLSQAGRATRWRRRSVSASGWSTLDRLLRPGRCADSRPEPAGCHRREGCLVLGGDIPSRGAQMKVFLAGASGAIGRQLIPRLLQSGHDVVGMTRTPAKAAALDELGARRGRRRRAAGRAGRHRGGRRRPRRDHPRADRHRRAEHAPLRPRLRPHQSPADRGHRSPAVGGPRGRRASASSPRASRAGPTPVPDRGQGRERAAGPGARAATMRGYAGRDPPPRSRRDRGHWTEGIVLRYGFLYGPGTSIARGGDQLEMIRKGKFPVIGDRRGHMVLRARQPTPPTPTVAALQHGRRGIYNVVDDEPAPVADWLPAVAATLGARKPLAGATSRRAPGCRRGGRGDDDLDPWRLQRQGAARSSAGCPRTRAGAEALGVA